MSGSVREKLIDRSVWWEALYMERQNESRAKRRLRRWLEAPRYMSWESKLWIRKAFRERMQGHRYLTGQSETERPI